jgi:hypothetical protein
MAYAGPIRCLRVFRACVAIPQHRAAVPSLPFGRSGFRFLDEFMTEAHFQFLM